MTVCITTIPMRTIHPFLLAKKIPFTYSKPQVIRLMSQILQRHFPKDWLSPQGKTQTSLHVRAIRSRPTGTRHRHRRICKSNLLKWKHWLSTKGGTPRPQNWCDFFSICFTKCFRNKSESVFETKIKLFLFLKWKYFHLQTKLKVFPKLE